MAKRAKKASGTVIDTSGYDYTTTRIRNEKTGKIIYSTGKGDAVAKAMLLHRAAGGTTEQIVKANKLKLEAGNRSPGLFRMSVAGTLRAKVRAGEHMTIGDVVVKSLEQRIAMPEVKATAAPVARKAKSPKAARKAAVKQVAKAKRAYKRKAPVAAEAEAA